VSLSKNGTQGWVPLAVAAVAAVVVVPSYNCIKNNGQQINNVVVNNNGQQ
jgi:hypothetical protein